MKSDSLSGVMPVLAMLDGRAFLVPVERRKTTPEVVVDVDIALPGRDEPPGVTSPDRDPIYEMKVFTIKLQVQQIQLVTQPTRKEF